LAFSGIVVSQTKSEFPKLEPEKAVGVNFFMCQSGPIALTEFEYENDVSYIAYTNKSGLLFAVGKFVKGEYAGVFILLPDKSVIFYEAKDVKKTPKVCETLDLVTPKANPQIF
jgi:hypothetical protein